MSEQTATAATQISPLFSSLFRPRTTIQKLGGRISLVVLVLLCSLAAAARMIASFSKGAAIGIVDVPALLLLFCLVALLSLVVVYFCAFLASKFGRWMGGKANPENARAAMAWGSSPSIWAGLIAMAIVVVRPDGEWETWHLAVEILVGVATIWTAVVTIMMLMAVHQFGVIRSTLAYACATLLSVVLLALPVRVFLWQPFDLKSGNLIPTLLPGDHVFVSKSTYGYSRFSFPFHPPFQGRIFAKLPKRGDLVVFALPQAANTTYIKRIIGLPGETIHLRDGVVYINDKAVPRERIKDYKQIVNGKTANLPQYVETLPNGVSHRILDSEPNGPFDNVGPFQIPEGHYFVMGDNRDNSSDSRAKWAVGYVPFENLIGRVEVIYMSVPKGAGDRSGRMLMRVR